MSSLSETSEKTDTGSPTKWTRKVLTSKEEPLGMFPPRAELDVTFVMSFPQRLAAIHQLLVIMENMICLATTGIRSQDHNKGGVGVPAFPCAIFPT